MLLHLFTGKNLAGRMELPLPPHKSKQLLEEIRTASQSTSPVTIYNVDSVISGLGWHLQYTELDDSALQKLNRLAQAIDGLDAAGLRCLKKALSTEERKGLDEVLRIVSGIRPGEMDACELIPEVATDRALGKWLIKHGRFEVPEHLRPHLNHESIGRAYRFEHDGVFLSNGYVGTQPEDMKQENGILRLKITAEGKEICLSLPAAEDQLEAYAQAGIRAVNFSVPHLDELIPLESATVEEANTLALCLQEMKQEDGGIMKYCAVLTVETPVSFSEAVTIAMDRDDYELVPEDMEEYGKQVLRRAGADDEVIDTIDGYMDFAQLGKDVMQEDGVRRTEFGLVRRISAPFPVNSMEQTMS